MMTLIVSEYATQAEIDAMIACYEQQRAAHRPAITAYWLRRLEQLGWSRERIERRLEEDDFGTL